MGETFTFYTTDKHGLLDELKETLKERGVDFQQQESPKVPTAGMFGIDVVFLSQAAMAATVGVFIDILIRRGIPAILNYRDKSHSPMCIHITQHNTYVVNAQNISLFSSTLLVNKEPSTDNPEPGN